MEAYSKHHGIVLPLDRANVDTDAIIPATYLKMITRTGFAEGLFSNWRYYRSRTREPNPEFVLNMPRYVGATVLLARENLGCGSSREHAPWALWEYGFKTLIASSFADIFYTNCLNVGILPIRLEAGLIQSLFEEVEANEGYALDIDLPAQTVTTSTGRVLAFELDHFRKDALLRGLDPIGYTLQYQASIAAYEQRRKQELPWYFHDIPA